MLISDLSYLESLSKSKSSPSHLISGGAVLEIDAGASVNMGTTVTGVDITLKNRGNVTIAKGTGIAIAIGTAPDADVEAYSIGFDKVKIKIRSKQGENYAFESIKVLAIDRPNR